MNRENSVNGRLAQTQTESRPNEVPLLEAVHLHKKFPVQKISLTVASRAVHAVDDVSLALQAGRAIALVGESGSGKTTVARILSGMYAPTAGEIRYRGTIVDVKGDRALRKYRRHVQLIFQDPFASLNTIHSIRYHLSRPLRLHGHVHTAEEEEKAILALLERVSLYPAEQFIEKLPHQLSGGQRQRVAIARALAVQPSVLLADEPVSMLDVSIRLDMLNLLLRLKDEERLGVLFITHDLASARYFAEDTRVMYAGQMVEGGSSDDVIQYPKHPYTQLLLSAAPDPDTMKSGGKLVVKREQLAKVARGEALSLINPPPGCRFHQRCPHAMPVCSERFPARTDLGGDHWTHCFLYGDGGTASQEVTGKVLSSTIVQEGK